jgi:regulator of protease activity HflC (stomatin/prohibitin superfamily)
VLLVLVGLLAGVISQAVRVVRDYERLVVFRLGKCIGSRGPGPVLLIPFVDRPVRVDQRELFLEVPHQSCITKDNVPIQIDFLIYRQVLDPVASVLAVTNFAGASQGIAATTLRALIGDIPLDDVLAQRERINAELRQKLDDVTERWGGKRQATISVAEGERQAQILRAEGDKEAAILKAEGYAQALQTVFGAAQQIDSKTMTLQVIDGLKALGASPSSKFVIPMEFTRLLGQVGSFLDQSLQAGSEPATPAAAPVPPLPNGSERLAAAPSISVSSDTSASG